MTLENGYLLNDRYRIDEIIAQGGMGAIYRATDLALDIQVAVKENFLAIEEAIRQFKYEARILANLRHPNLPRVTDHFEIENQGQYLVMDYVDGKDLKDILAESGAISESQAIMIGKAVCHALDYLHSRVPPIVHRDIKPGNIKITTTNQIYLVDFGLAKQAVDGEATMTGAQALTPGFAPPEQYGQGTDPRTDIYSLGATLYAAVTVDAPPDGLTRAAKNQTIVDIRTNHSSVSVGLEAIIQKAMMLASKDRYQNAGEFLDELNHVDEIPAINIGTDSTKQQRQVVPSKKGREESPSMGSSVDQNDHTIVSPKNGRTQKKPFYRQAWFYLLLLVFIAIGVVGFVSVFNKVAPNILAENSGSMTATQNSNNEEHSENTDTPIEPTRTEVVLEVTNAELPITATPKEVVVEVTDTPENLPTATLEAVIEVTPVGGGNGSIAFASDREGEPQIYLIDLASKDVNKLTEMSGGACQPDFSPDGQRLVFTSPCDKDQQDYQGSRLFIMNVDGSGLIPLNTLPGGDFDPDWNPDDPNLIAFTSYRENSRPHLFIYHLDDRSVTSLSPVIAYDRAPEWSPDGKYLVFQQVYEGVNGIFYMDLETLKRKSLSNLSLESTSPLWSNDGNLIYFSQGKSLPGLLGRQINNLSSPAVNISDIKPIWEAVFSPDDYWISFRGLGEGSNRDLFIMLSTGGLLEKLTDDAADDFDPVFRP